MAEQPPASQQAGDRHTDEAEAPLYSALLLCVAVPCWVIFQFPKLNFVLCTWP
jgi:hypothetical protein